MSRLVAGAVDLGRLLRVDRGISLGLDLAVVAVGITAETVRAQDRPARAAHRTGRPGVPVDRRARVDPAAEPEADQAAQVADPADQPAAEQEDRANAYEHDDGRRAQRRAR